ncbi:LysR family transcriptional regulator [Rhodobacteraceae bacterium B1Z28]|uniref:LysR family transcriptional regulator n=1 Tax=Ruegeria haliotis TaxID=2747601 RepID=A0ABX2PS18_9RHOB|nr:LysR family transcriptional regulator [Ruegeria haliotis]NVO56955.1 LysR family transcriptional regulator [Ruegeria haliotis]
MPSLDAIAVFSQVARSQSFTEAAHALNVPLSTVSRKVSELEANLNTRLIDRSKRQIRLTEAGATYFDLCRKGLDTLEYANRVMLDRHSDTAGTVTITVPPNLMEVLFLKAIETFQLRYPKARLRVLVSERMLDFVDDCVDLSFRVAPPKQPDLVVRTLLRYRHRLVAAPSYASVHNLPRKLSELSRHKRIGFGFNSGRNVTWSFSRAATTEDTKFEPDLAINDYAAIRAAVVAGQGVGELPEPLCKNDLRDGKLVEVLPEWRFPKIQLFAVHSGNTSLTKLARLFLDLAAEEMR